MPTWDENKRRLNIKSHGIDFEGCEQIFDLPVIVSEDSRQNYGEQRLCALGWLHDRMVHLTYTERKDDFRVISLRKAEKHEIKRYLKETSR
jgi:uncharacterized protein